MPIDFSKRIYVPDHVLYRELEGESVLLNVNSERYFGLDPVGTQMWKIFSVSESIEQAYAQLLELYDVEPDVLRFDLQELILRLQEQGLVEVISEGTGK